VVEKELDETQTISKRLDALIRLFIEMNKDKKQGEKFNEATAARILKSVGLTPTEIAKILGKKSATDISQYLYSKTKG
jgi:sialic acid synthase SpsE